MSSVLIVSGDPYSLAQIEQLGDAMGVRVRSVSSIAASKEWLAMQQTEMLLIDARYDDTSVGTLLSTAWKRNPFMIGAVFDLTGKPINAFGVKMLGARVYSGPNALDNIKQTLEFLPTIETDLNADTVLLVDDLDAPRYIICTYIESLGVPRVVGAESAQQALQLLLRKPESFFLVITDINMPNINGIELLTTIRNDPLLEHLPVSMVTAYATAENLVECVRAGASGFLAKPLRKKELCREIEKARRIMITKQSPRLCKDEDAHLVEDALSSFLTS